jgi:flagellar protein FlaJ
MLDPSKFIARISDFLPNRLKVPLEENIIWAQLRVKSLPVFVGTLMVLFVIIGMVAAFLVVLFTGFVILAPVAFIGGILGAYFIIRSLLAMFADTVSTQIEKVLPDMLMLMAANLRAGMIPENSFLASIKPEFGKLNVLLGHAAIEVQGGKDFRDALIEMSNLTNSRFFRDTMRIIGEGLRSGAELHLILENLAQNILQNETIRNDMKAQVRSYALFIFLAATIAAPLLYGVASFLIGILDNIGSLSSSTASVPSSATGLFSSFSLPYIPPSLVILISTINVVITTSSSAILNGILNTGNPKDGFRFVPLFVIIGVGIFFAVRFGVSIFFASSSLAGGGGV